MGLFNKKKDMQRDSSGQSVSSDIPEFPTLHDDEFPEFPTYESTVEDIKSEVDKGSEEFEIPSRDSQVKKKLPAADLTFSPRNIPEEGKPLFIQVDRYKGVLSSMDNIKSKLNEVESLLKKLDTIKEDEDSKLESLRKDLDSMKEKLLSVDRELFEV